MSAYQALMLMLVFATFVVALLTFIFSFLLKIKDRPVNFGQLRTIFY